LYLLLLAPWLLREKIRGRDAGFMGAILLGLGLIFLGGQSASATAPHPIEGNLIAALAGLTWALTVVGLRGTAGGGTGSGGSTAGAVLAGNVIAFAVCLPMALPVATARPADWIVLVYLGVFQIGLAYACLASGMRHVPALEASLLLLVEPVLN